jgi:hypothetical protein
MDGSVHFDGSQLVTMLPEAAADFIRRFQVGAGYQLDGRFAWDKEQMTRFGFEGTLLGRDLQLMGYELKTLGAKVSYDSDSLSITDLALVDSAGKLRIDQLDLNQTRFDAWQIDMPLLLVEDLKPSLLSPVDGEGSGPRAFVVRKAEVRDLHGNLGDLRTLTGHGEVDFINPSGSTFRKGRIRKATPITKPKIAAIRLRMKLNLS